MKRIIKINILFLLFISLIFTQNDFSNSNKQQNNENNENNDNKEAHFHQQLKFQEIIEDIDTNSPNNQKNHHLNTLNCKCGKPMTSSAHLIYSPQNYLKDNQNSFSFLPLFGSSFVFLINFLFFFKFCSIILFLFFYFILF